jgi:hypothetical protein
MTNTRNERQIRSVRISDLYRGITFDISPLNILEPANIPQLEEIVRTLESDERVKIVIFDSLVDEQQPGRRDERTSGRSPACGERATIAERELAKFISFVTNFLSSEPTKLLRDIWLDELASRDTMPEPASFEWRLVTVAAIARLAGTVTQSRALRAWF